jgi:hypothetical protein
MCAVEVARGVGTARSEFRLRCRCWGRYEEVVVETSIRAWTADEHSVGDCTSPSID